MQSSIQTRTWEVRDLGLIDYDAMYQIQRQCVDEVLQGGRQRLLLCEHPAIITLGRMSNEMHIIDRQGIKQAGIRVVSIDRGGDVTLHAPGQLVVYPILDLVVYGRDLKRYLYKLEQVAIDLLNSLGIVANRISGKTGVFSGPDKIVSLGIGVRRWIVFHGMAINVNTDLALFDLIKPCGLDVRMTSIADIKGERIAIEEVKENFIRCFGHRFDAPAQGLPR